MADDFSVLRGMKYSGRGITLGATPSGNQFVGYSLTGRSSSSQARKLVYDEQAGVIRTDVTDETQLERGSPALLIYPAIAFGNEMFVASNGAQTKLVYARAVRTAETPEKVLRDAFDSPVLEYDTKDKRWIDITTYEPDDPNFTPRISACLDGICGEAGFHITRKEGLMRQQEIHTFKLNPGEGRVITTYLGGNENPLLPFVGAPLRVQIQSESAQEIAESIYDSIRGGEKPEDNFRVAAAVAMTGPRGIEVVIINREITYGVRKKE